MFCVCWRVDCSILDDDISVIDEVNFDVVCPSVVDNGGGEAEDLLVEIAVSSVEPLSSVDNANVDVLMESVSVVEGN